MIVLCINDINDIISQNRRIVRAGSGESNRIYWMPVPGAYGTNTIFRPPDHTPAEDQGCHHSLKLNWNIDTKTQRIRSWNVPFILISQKPLNIKIVKTKSKSQVQILNPKSKVQNPEERDWDWGWPPNPPPPIIFITRPSRPGHWSSLFSFIFGQD